MFSLKNIKLNRGGGCLEFLLIFCLLPLAATGLYLEEVDVHSFKNTEIAYYPGSFDPLHLGHLAVVETVLNKGLADYVLIYALPDSDVSKKRTPHKVRFSMLESVYKAHPKVIITKLMPSEMQEKLFPLFKHIKFSVVLGSDIVNMYVKTSQYDAIWMKGLSIKQTNPEHTNTSTGAIMAIPAIRVIAFNREGEDLSYVGGVYKNRPISILTPPTNADLSSTEARLSVRQGKSLVGIVPPEVNKIILDNGLYTQPD